MNLNLQLALIRTKIELEQAQKIENLNKRIQTLLEAKEKQHQLFTEKNLEIRELEKQKVECINDEIELLAKNANLQKTIFGLKIKVKYFEILA